MWDAQLAALRKTSEWERAAFIKKGGWDTLSGLKETVTGAAKLCAQLLVTEKVPAARRRQLPGRSWRAGGWSTSGNAKSLLSTCTKFDHFLWAAHESGSPGRIGCQFKHRGRSDDENKNLCRCVCSAPDHRLYVPATRPCPIEATGILSQ